jgi:hypothetical protein
MSEIEITPLRHNKTGKNNSPKTRVLLTLLESGLRLGLVKIPLGENPGLQFYDLIARETISDLYDGDTDV